MAQTTASGQRVAMVHFQPVGAYTSGTGRLRVEIGYVWLPGVRRTIWIGTTARDAKPGQFVEWLDGRTLQLIEQQQELVPGWVEWRLPFLLEVPWSLLTNRT